MTQLSKSDPDRGPKDSGNDYQGIQDTCTFSEIGTNKLPGVFGTIKLPRVRLKNSG
jgi:hypothetical protein